MSGRGGAVHCCRATRRKAAVSPERMSGSSWKNTRDLYSPVHTQYTPPAPPKTGGWKFDGVPIGARLLDALLFGHSGTGQNGRPLVTRARRASWRISRDLYSPPPPPKPAAESGCPCIL